MVIYEPSTSKFKLTIFENTSRYGFIELIKLTLEKHKYNQCRSHCEFQLARGPSSKTRCTADQVDFFVFCALDSQRFWVLPFEAATVVTLKIYNGEDTKLHRYEDAWILLEK